MRPVDRENNIYNSGKLNQIGSEESLLFQWLEDILKLSNHPPKGLDIGCGMGSITKKIQESGCVVKGYDFSDVAIQRAIESGVDAYLRDFDTGIPEADNSFDFIWCTDVIEHVFDPIFLFEEFNRVLRPSGKVFMTIPNNMAVGNRVMALFGISPQSTTYRNYRQCKHHTMFSIELMKYMITIANFKIEQFVGLRNYPFLRFMPRKNKKKSYKGSFYAGLFAHVFCLQLVKSSDILNKTV